MKKYWLLIVLFLLTSCAKTITVHNIVTSSQQDTLKQLLNEYHMNDPMIFNEINTYNNAVSPSANLVSEEVIPSKLAYNEENMGEDWAKVSPDFSDINCRITSFLLVHPVLSIDSEESEGNYIMFDVDAFNTNPKLQPYSTKLGYFKALFKELPYSETDSIESLFPTRWNSAHTTLPNNVSLISVLVNDTDGKVLFHAHSGVCIKNNDEYIYIEKLAPNQPYQVYRFKDIRFLVNELLKRKEYKAYQTSSDPMIYQNDVLLNKK